MQIQSPSTVQVPVDQEISTTKDTMLITVHTSHDLCQHVVLLNNLAVHLMEAYAFKSARAALKEAVFTIKDAIRPGQGDQCNIESTPRSNAVVFECTKRLMEAKSFNPFSSGALHGLGIPILIQEIVTRVESPEGQNYENITAVLLFNFGLLNRWAGFTSMGQASLKFKESASRLLTMSLSTLSSSRIFRDPTAMENITEVRLFLLIQVLNALSQIEAELDKHVDANAHLQQLETLAAVAFFKVNFGNAIHLPGAPAA